MKGAPSTRIRSIGEPNLSGDYVLYWMIAFRRPTHNFALQHAVSLAEKWNKPLVIFEPLRAHYPWSSIRLHQFVVQGMRDNTSHFANRPVTYLPFVELKPGDGKPHLKTLAKNACAVVSDDFPCFFLPKMVQAAKRAVPCQFTLIDSNGIIPLRAADKAFFRAYDFRRFMQKNIANHWNDFPEPDPLKKVKLPTIELEPAFTSDPTALLQTGLSEIPYLCDVPKVDLEGGFVAAKKRLDRFVSSQLDTYNEDRNHPDRDAVSGLSPYLHFGHISSHEVFAAVTKSDGWNRDDVAESSKGQREGWWGASPEVEAYLDQIVTWREVGFNMCANAEDYDKFESLPDWALKTLQNHAADTRPYIYSRAEFENAETHDDIWNAAQRQLVQEGVMQNYLRMLWGKKILHWTRSPEEALDIMIELNNKYALDGRDPNSYSGIFWVLGRYDRAWGPEREIFGKIRYMTSDSTRRKLKLKNYLQKFGNTQQTLGDL